VAGWVERCLESLAVNDAHLLFLSFSCLPYCQAKARLYDTVLSYDITKQRLTMRSAENRILSVFRPSLLSDASVSTIRLRVLDDDEHCLFKAFRCNTRQESLNSTKTQHARLLVRHACCNTIHDFHFAFVSGNASDHATFLQACRFLRSILFLNVEEFLKVDDGFVNLSSIRNSLGLPASLLFASSLG
jgi:hypothetical protein